MNPARLVVLASGGGRTLENLEKKIQEGYLHARIELVIVSSASIGAKQRAEKLELPCLVISKQSYPDREGREHRLLNAIFEARPDYVLLAGWLQLLPIPEQLEGKVLNIHPALLPAFGGQGFYGHHVHEAVAASGLRYSGCTVHFATSQYDVGPIILQSAVLLPEKVTSDQIADLVFAQECQAYPEALRFLLEGVAVWQDGQVLWA